MKQTVLVFILLLLMFFPANTKQTEKCYIQKEIISKEYINEKYKKNKELIYYGFEKLDSTEKEMYTQMCEMFLNVEDAIFLINYKKDNLEKVFQYILNDHPEIYYCTKFEYVELENEDLKRTLKIIPEYNCEKEEIIKINKQMKDIAKHIIEENKNNDEKEIVKNICDYVVKNTTYKTDCLYNQDIRSVFLNNESVCTGYAKAVQYLLQKYKIESYLIFGWVDSNSIKQEHAWLIVNINGVYYHCDPTWCEIMNSTEEINYSYVLCDEKEIFKTHEYKKDTEF